MIKNINQNRLPKDMSKKEEYHNGSRVNYFINTKKFINSVIKDDKTIAIFLDIASAEKRTCGELQKDLGFDEKTVHSRMINLKENSLIEPNPNPESKKYRLSFNGKLFLEQLKVMFPRICSIL